MRHQLRHVLDKVEFGEELTIVRRNRPVARLIPYQFEAKRLPSMKKFRESIQEAVRSKKGTLKGSLTQSVLEERKEARF